MTFENQQLPLGCRWRSSQWFITTCITIALFSENFLFSYIVPILQVMLEDRLHVDKSQTQTVTSIVLSANAIVSMLTSPFIGHLADKLSSRRTSLLLSLGAEMVGTIVIMISPSVTILLAGRTIQGVGGNAAWIVGLTTLTDTMGPDRTGRTLGTISSFTISGLLFGPLTSGVLLRAAGYWVTWSVAVAVLAVDMVMRMLMVEKGCGEKVRDSAASPHPDEADERTSLLPDSVFAETEHSGSSKQARAPQASMTDVESASSQDATSLPENFWKFMLTSSRALTAIACHCTMAITLLSLDTTLPLYASRTFGWDTAQISLLFLLLQVPTLLLVSLVGMLKDRLGTRFLTGFGFLATWICLWLLGAAAEDKPKSSGALDKDQILFMTALVGIGIARTFVSGSGILEITNVMKDALKEKPDRFGPNGRMSSAYALTNFSWNAGRLLGPTISGSLTRIVGYYYMNSALACLSLGVGVLSIAFLDKR